MLLAKITQLVELELKPAFFFVFLYGPSALRSLWRAKMILLQLCLPLNSFTHLLMQKLSSSCFCSLQPDKAL